MENNDKLIEATPEIINSSIEKEISKNEFPQLKVVSVDSETGEAVFDIDDNFINAVKAKLNIRREPYQEELEAVIREILSKAASLDKQIV